MGATNFPDGITTAALVATSLAVSGAQTGVTAGSTTKAGAVLAVPITHRVVVMTTGGAEALTLADGVAGQRLLVILGTDGGDGTLTPAHCTGFATIVFADAKDFADLEFVDSTIGWILVGYGGTAAPPVIT